MGQRQRQRSRGDPSQERESNSRRSANNIIDDLNINRKMRAVLEDSEDEYEKPFDSPDELMQIFEMLEEKNLFLIQQGQENRKLLEEKRLEYNTIKQREEFEFGNLENREKEMQARIDKTQSESLVLKASDQDDSTKIIKPDKLVKLVELSRRILGMFQDKQRDIKPQPPVQMLLEIEAHIETAAAYIKNNEAQDKDLFGVVLKEVKKIVKNERAEEENKRKKEEEDKIMAAKKNNPKQIIVSKDIRQERFVSTKKAVKRQKERKVEYTQLQLDMRAYGGEALFQQVLEWEKQNQ